MEITAQMAAENARLAKQQRKVEILANSKKVQTKIQELLQKIEATSEKGNTSYHELIEIKAETTMDNRVLIISFCSVFCLLLGLFSQSTLTVFASIFMGVWLLFLFLMKKHNEQLLSQDEWDCVATYLSEKGFNVRIAFGDCLEIRY